MIGPEPALECALAFLGAPLLRRGAPSPDGSTRSSPSRRRSADTRAGRAAQPRDPPGQRSTLPRRLSHAGGSPWPRPRSHRSPRGRSTRGSTTRLSRRPSPRSSSGRRGTLGRAAPRARHHPLVVRPGGPGDDRRPPRLARRCRSTSRIRSGRSRRFGEVVRDAGFDDRDRGRHGRQQPRPRRARDRPSATSRTGSRSAHPRLDRPGRGRRDVRRPRSARDALHRRHEVGHHHRDARLPGRRLGANPRGAPRGPPPFRLAGRAHGRHHRPGRSRSARSPTTTDIPQVFLNPSRHRRPLLRPHATSAWSRRRSSGSTSTRSSPTPPRCAPPAWRPTRSPTPGIALGATLGALAIAGRDKLTLVVDPALALLGAWVEQLVAESTGKRGDRDRADRPASRSAPPRRTVRTASSSASRSTAPRRWSPRMAPRPTTSSRPSPRPATRSSASSSPTRSTSAASSSAGRSRRRSPGIVLGIDPFDEPNVDRGEGATRRASSRSATTTAGSRPRCRSRPATASPSTATRRFASPPAKGPSSASCAATSTGRTPAATSRSAPSSPRRLPGPPRSTGSGPASATRPGWRPRRGYGPALPPLHRPAPQGRAGDRLVPPADIRPSRTTCRCPASRTRSASSSTPRPAATSRLSRRTSSPVLRVHLGADVDAGLAALDEALAAALGS